MRGTGVVALLAGLAAAGCSSLAGNGDIVEEARPVPAFMSVAVGSGFQAILRLADAAKVTVRGDSNLLPYVSVTVREGVLTAGIEGVRSLSPTQPILVDVQGPALQGVSVSGGAGVTAEGIGAAAFQVEASGGGEVVLSGAGGETLHLSVSGGAKVDASDWPAARVDAVLSGGSRGVVRAATDLRALLSGGSTMACFGQPAGRKVDASGGSSVRFE